MNSYHHLPKPGHTRCYWALLSTDLQFIYLDPVFAYHLDAQADLLIGKSLLSLIHPDELASAETDLKGILESQTLHGSATRVRFSRLCKIRRQLGYTGPFLQCPGGEKISGDANYRAVDIAINWAVAGLVLCFFHATADLDSQNDSKLLRSRWTNQCGTPWMSPEQIQLLSQRLNTYLPQPPFKIKTGAFQILANQPGHQLLISWPPDQGNGDMGREFAKVMRSAGMASNLLQGDAKTSCTQRYKTKQPIWFFFGEAEVESIFIPHGSVIFACHKVEPNVHNTLTNATDIQHQTSPNAPSSNIPLLSEEEKNMLNFLANNPALVMTPSILQQFITQQTRHSPSPSLIDKSPHLQYQEQRSSLSPDSPQARCRSLIFQILGNRERRVQARKFLGEDAQIMVDYLNIASRELSALERRRALSLLCKLAKSARVFPRCYELRGIEYNPEPVAGGGFSEVYMGKYEDELICLKVVRVYQKQQSEEILRANVQELALWAHLQHKNILPFYGVYLLGSTTPRICLVSPWMENGNLRDHLNEFPQKPRMPFVSDIVEGLMYLHGLHIIHRDLKAQNVLVSNDGRALITDFGLSFVAATTTTTSMGGTARFMAPEFLEDSSQLTKFYDIWSFGCLCYEVLTDKMPFYQYNDAQVMRALMREEIPLRPRAQPGSGVDCGELDDRVWDLLVRCWNYTPQDRPSCEGIRDAVGDLGIRDDRPETVTDWETGCSAFWQAMREKSNDQLDYARVEELLLRIQNPS